MNDETRTALLNFTWLLNNRDNVEIDWRSDTLLYGDGGCTLNTLTEVGFTPATTVAREFPRWSAEAP